MKNHQILRSEEADLGGGGGSLIANPAPAAVSEPAPPAASASPFDFRQLVGDDGRFSADWTSKLPDGLKEHSAHFSKYGDPVQALQHTLSLSQLLGKKSDAVVIPAADAPKEEWAPVLKRLGVPESPEGYGLKVPESLPEGVNLDPAEIGEFSKFAHEIGLTPQQAAKLQEYDITRAGKSVAGSQAETQAAQQASFKAESDALNKAWGTGNERTQKVAMAERAALTFGFSPEEISGENANPLFGNARFIMTLARAGEAMGEDKIVKGADVSSGGGLKARAMDVINNPANPMHARYWKGDEGINNQVQGWIKAGK